MKPVKHIFGFFLGAVFASSWWAGWYWFPLPVVIIPIVETIVLCGACGAWMAEHWSD